MKTKRIAPQIGRWVPGCKIDAEGNVIAGATLYATASAARNHDERSRCQATAVKVRVCREGVSSSGDSK